MDALARSESVGRRPDFDGHLERRGLGPLERERLTTLQVNVGKLCNQACLHCHVEAGPKRTEIMTLETVERILELLAASPEITTVDLTGGAPELNPSFRRFVEGLRALGKTVIDRCNLTVMFEPGMDWVAPFLAEHQVEVVASLPCYTADNVEKQRGKGVFGKSIEGLLLLNRLGYGRGTGLSLSLVYNPLGPSLPPAQAALEADYKRELREHFGIEFDRLFTITNMPIKRFAQSLARDGADEAYMELLVGAFNPQAVPGLMCRSLVSVGWDGALYDCDFNQMLEIPVPVRAQRTIFAVERFEDLEGARIATDSHCFGCTAGAGSSCGGATV